MSLKNMERKKYYKQNKHKIWEKEKKRQLITSIVCIAMVIMMVVAPVLIQLTVVAENNNTYATEDETTPLYDENGVEIGHAHADGTEHLDEDIATLSNAIATPTEIE